MSTPARAASTAAGFSGYQKLVAALLAFLSFTTVLDFMVLAPLGALLMPALKITPSQFGTVVSAYAFSAGIGGILTAGFADRFDRRKLLLIFYAGFLVGTLLCGLASSYAALLLARMITGFFAGVVGSVSMAIVTDVFPFEMRGRAMGIIQTAFAASTVLGLPLALLLSTHWSWNVPFYMIVGVGSAVAVLIKARLQPVDQHLTQQSDRNPLHHLVHTVSKRRYLQGFATTCLLSVGGFMLMPFMSAFTVHNIGLPLDRLPLVYIIMGLFSAVAGPLIGRASDAVGKLPVFAFGCALTILMVLVYTHLGPTPMWILVTVMVLLQIGIFSRIISSTALLSALPDPADRGAYMSISSSLQQMAGGVAALVSGLVVVENADGTLLHFDKLGYVLVATTLITLTMMYFIDRKLSGRQPIKTAVPQPAAAAAD